MPNISKSDIHSALWTNIVNRVNSIGLNQPHGHAQGSMYFSWDPRGNTAWNSTRAIPYWNEMLNAGKAVARYYSNVVWSLYGIYGDDPSRGAYSAWAYFYVEAWRHQNHHDSVSNWIVNHYPANAGKMTLWSMQNQFNILANVIIDNRSMQIPDLRVCHGSCHGNCHQSRGRR